MADITTYTLMNKDTPVLTARYNLDDHVFTDETKSIEIENREYAPLGAFVYQKDGTELTAASLNNWWRGRSIPTSSVNYMETRSLLPLSIAELKDKNNGVSLSDQYWIKQEDSDLTWQEVNYFTNPFSDDVGKALFGEITEEQIKSADFSLMTPNATVNGNLLKRWKLSGTKRVLVKSGSAKNIMQEPLNEYIATKLYERLLAKEDYVSYRLTEHDSYSICENMIGEDEELIPTWQVLNYYDLPEDEDLYENTVGCYRKLGLPEEATRLALAKMLVCDTIIANADRHLNNFGVIRDVNTLEVKRVAPLWDNGIALYCNYGPQAAEDAKKQLPATCWSYSCMPYQSAPNAQLALVDDYSWYVPDNLAGFDEEVAELLRSTTSKDISDRRRIDTVYGHLTKRLETLDRFALEWQLEHNRDHVYVHHEV
jgi:hypothetical protein